MQFLAAWWSFSLVLGVTMGRLLLLLGDVAAAAGNREVLLARPPIVRSARRFIGLKLFPLVPTTRLRRAVVRACIVLKRNFIQKKP